MTSRIGILGGGQLARMTAYAAFRLGFQVGILEREEESPASFLTPNSWVGSWNDQQLLDELATYADVVTLENEFVDGEALTYLESCGVHLYPSARTLATIQDKFLQKTALKRAGLPVPRFAAVESPPEILDCARSFGWPLMLKARRNGYDGYGNELLRTPEDVIPAFEKLARRSGLLMVEEFVPFTKELAIMVARSSHGDETAYPVVETIQHAHMCHTVLAPAAISENSIRRASELGKRIMTSLDAVGIFGIELFLMTDGDLMINEIAPRPHNSGHFSIEGCFTSQFENHVRSIVGLPLGSTQMVAPAAVMVNVLGTNEGPAQPKGLTEALSIPGAHVHLYGKKMSRPGRKMGHVTATGQTVAEAREIALRAARLIMI
ncbi:MAG: 5-(carboxyamino)imidazole ribonucleotide synthase [Acidobacteria bacterium]|nr:5-(carboxyamino)imidazole ribonucleotide synthase [Acidobacteriota bacterium]